MSLRRPQYAANFMAILATLCCVSGSVASAAQAQGLPSADDAAWAAAEAADTPEAYQQYLEEFPAGRHADEAFRCLIEGQSDVAPGAGQDFDVY